MGRASDPRSSMAAGCGRAMKPGRGKSGGPRGGRWMASVCSPRAFRCGPMPSSRMTPSPPRSGRREAPGAIRSKARRRAASRRACGKRPRGAACLVETVTLQQHRARPGCPAPSPTAFSEAADSRARFSFPERGREKRRLMPRIRPVISDRSPRLPIGEINMREINHLMLFRTALTCGGRAYRFRAEFRPPSTPVSGR